MNLTFLLVLGIALIILWAARNKLSSIFVLPGTTNDSDSPSGLTTSILPTIGGGGDGDTITTTTGSSPPPLPPAGGGGVDPLGIKKLYPSSGKVPDWYMGSTNLQSDPRVELEGTVVPQSAGIYEAHVTTKDNPASFRIHVLSKGSRDYNAQLAAGGADWALMAKRGYFMDPGEWKNVEMTIYYMVKTNVEDDMSLYARGGGHGHGWPISCLGNCYICNIRTRGEPRFAKEMWHDGSAGYVFLNGEQYLNIGPVQNKWIGMKGIIKDIPGGVRMETFVDTTGGTDPSKQNWKIMAKLDDMGNLPGMPDVVTHCHATSASQIMSWGGPSATFRIDSNIVDVKWASCREIVPNAIAVAGRAQIYNDPYYYSYHNRLRQIPDNPLMNIGNIRR